LQSVLRGKGTKEFPFFVFQRIMKTTLVEKSVREALKRKFSEEEYEDCFVVEINISKGNKVIAYIECDGPLTLRKCQTISRYLEKEIEENQWLGEKYTLEVSSPGTDRPLIEYRQYQKNVGRNIKITDQEDTVVKGKLVVVEEKGIEVLEKLKKEEKQHVLPFNKIKEAKILVSFK
jgi:ribosome maturation factor RimP